MTVKLKITKYSKKRIDTVRSWLIKERKKEERMCSGIY